MVGDVRTRQPHRGTVTLNADHGGNIISESAGIPPRRLLALESLRPGA